VKAKSPLSLKKDNLTSLQKAAGVVAKMRAEAYELLGLNDENALDDELPELAITEYTPEELEQIRRGFEIIEDDLDEVEGIDLDLPFDDDDVVEDGDD